LKIKNENNMTKMVMIMMILVLLKGGE